MSSQVQNGLRLVLRVDGEVGKRVVVMAVEDGTRYLAQNIQRWWWSKEKSGVVSRLFPVIQM